MKRAFSSAGWIIFFTVCALAQTGSKGTPNPLVKPTLLVSFERQTIRESDSFLIDILVGNGDQKDLKDVVLQITSPDFLLWYEPQHEKNTLQLLDQNKLVIGNVAGNVLVRKKILVKSKPIIRVGSFNVLFTVAFKQDNTSDYVSAEKPVQVNLFGSDTVAGVPLALAGFIVPGLFFWVVTSWARLPWSVDVALGDKMIYSVVVSVVVVLVGTQLQWLDLDVENGIGVSKVFRLAMSGAALGIIVSVPVWIYRVYGYIRQRQQAELQINLNDSDETVFRKLLLKYSEVTQQQFRVTLNNASNDEYVGSLFQQTPSTPLEPGFIWIVGWCKITRTVAPQAETLHRLKRWSREIAAILKRRLTPEEHWKQMEALIKKRKLVELYDLAKRERFIMEWDGVAYKETGGLVNTSDRMRRWQNTEVSGMPRSEAGNTEPLRLI